jgi:hypothetical protein
VWAAERGDVPLPTEVRSYFEARFGHDFNRVRVHGVDPTVVSPGAI